MQMALYFGFSESDGRLSWLCVSFWANVRRYYKSWGWGCCRLCTSLSHCM